MNNQPDHDAMSEAPEPVATLGTDTVLDIQHDTDPEEDRGPVKRIPHIGHAILFFTLAFFFVLLCGVVAFSLARVPGSASPDDYPGSALASFAAAYALVLAISWQLFPRLWERSFLHGIQWNVLAAHRRWFLLIPAGIVTSIAAQFAERFVHIPPDGPVEKLMHTAHGAWALTAFGVLLAPLVEEIAFRGFLLPALATAYDWLAMERTPEGLRRWERSATHSTAALIFSAIFSTIPFALLHAEQLSHAWGAVSVIFGVGLVFAFVRIRTHSVACSALVHATYNASIFAAALYATGGYRHLEKL